MQLDGSAFALLQLSIARRFLRSPFVELSPVCLLKQPAEACGLKAGGSFAGVVALEFRRAETRQPFVLNLASLAHARATDRLLHPPDKR